MKIVVFSTAGERRVGVVDSSGQTVAPFDLGHREHGPFRRQPASHACQANINDRLFVDGMNGALHEVFKRSVQRRARHAAL